MSYCDTLQRLFALSLHGETMDLATPRRLHEVLGRPLGTYKSILIGGTNGKGSTAAFLEAALRRAGLRVGLFTSPHLVSYRERIRIDGELIDEGTVKFYAALLFAAADQAGLTPSFFETTWGLATLAFAAAEVDVVIWEVGLGGRLDATNVCTPIASAITNIDLDHTHILGDTLEAIAVEKAAIFRPGTPNLTAATGPALAAISKATSLPFVAVNPLPDMPELPLAGDHQKRNAALALAIANAIGVASDPSCLVDVRWPGRVERFPGNIFLDCAHNPAGARVLAEWVRTRNVQPLHLVFGAMAGKDVDGVIEALGPLAASVAVVTPVYPRRQTAAQLLPRFEAAGIAAHDAGTLADALRDRPEDRFCLVTGSCFLVGEARAHLTGEPFPECGLLTTAR